MQILNLVKQDSSNIKYKISKFPDGQQNITIDPGTLEIYYGAPKVHVMPVNIQSRLNNWLDLELIVASVASLREIGVEEIHLYVPYIVGARSDRKFESGGTNYLKDVLSPVINSLGFKTVTCIDPHSDVLEACIKNFRKESNTTLMQFAQQNLPKDGEYILMTPDAGASKKIYKLAEQIGYKGDIITCSKDRDIEGKLTKTNVPLKNLSNKNIIIIDDICDGGATFINIAKVIKNHYIGHSCPKIYLVVTHGVFSKGFEELAKYFDGIYSTNSYSNIKFESLTEGGFSVNQLNVF